MKKRYLNRWVYAALGVTVFLFAGMVYAWSVLSSPIASEFAAWTKAQLSMTFTIVMFMFCVGCTVTGFLLAKTGAGMWLFISAAMYLAGFFISSKASSLTGLYIGFGVICGLATGFAYNAVLGTVGKWFPDRQGLISGLLLMGFGMSSFIIGKIYQAATPETIGAWRKSFEVLGIASCAVLFVCGLFIVRPPEGYSAPGEGRVRKRYSNPVALEAAAPEMLRTPQFWLYFSWAVLLSSAGLALTSQASGMAKGVGAAVSPGTIATAVGLISVANGISRVIMGAAFDKAGRGAVMQIVNAGFILTGAVLTIALLKGSFPVLLVGFILGGLSYGGVTPTNSAFVSSYYGLKNYPLNLSLVNANLLIASFGSTVAGALYDASQSYMSTYTMIIALAVSGVAVSMLIGRCDKKQLDRGKY